jgi:hypothetical protein
MKRPVLFLGILFILANTLPLAHAQTTPKPKVILTVRRVGTLETLLDGLPKVKASLVWTTGEGRRLPYAAWPVTLKSRFSELFQKLMENQKDLGMSLPSIDESANGGSNRVYYSADQAFDLYAAHAAHVLFVEYKHLVPWTLKDFPEIQLEELLQSSSYVARIKPSPNQYPEGIQPNRDFQEAPENEGLGELNGDPRIGYLFLNGKTSRRHRNLIGATQAETLVNLTAWLRDNVGHGPLEGENLDKERAALQKHNRWLDGRLSAPAGYRTAVAILGCHSASKLMVDLARSVNIPLLHVRALDNQLKDDTAGHYFSRTHGGLIFGRGTHPLVLWHTDDVYAQPGSLCYPVDTASGQLLDQAAADKKFFETHWTTPGVLERAGFLFKLELVKPGEGYGLGTRGEYEDRYDFGMGIGYWNKKGASQLDSLYQIVYEGELCGSNMVQMAANQIIETQLDLNIKEYLGDVDPKTLPLLKPVKAYGNAARTALKGLGGSEKFIAIDKKREEDRGSDLMF